MNIIIVGAGKVGITIGEQLSSENHNITIIDLNQKKVEEAEEKFDVMGVVGNGASYQVQMEAGVMDAELLIAVTGGRTESALLSDCEKGRKVSDHSQSQKPDLQ